MSKFYRPSGNSTQLRGVASDIVLPSPSDLSDVNEASLKGPLPWDAIPAAPHEQLNRVQPYLSALREKSHHRIETEKAFAYLAEDVARIKKSMADKSVSLNEAERRQEMAQTKARQETRKQAELARPASQPKTYAITLKNASLPGLPPPLAPPKTNPTSGAKSDADRAAAAPERDILLHETMQILGGYVELLDLQPKGPSLAGPRKSTSPL